MHLREIMYQNQEQTDRVIGYVSRTISKTKCKYLANKLKFLAWMFVITEQFHEYLYGNNFVVYMDSNQLTYVLTIAKLDATGHCWVATLDNYNFIFSYKPGKANVEVGALSHIPWENHDQHIDADRVQGLISNVTQGITLIEVCACNIQITETLDMHKDPKAMSQKDWIIAQSQDPMIREIKYHISKSKLKGYKVYFQDAQILKQYLQQHSHLVVWKGSCIVGLPLLKRIGMLYSLQFPKGIRGNSINRYFAWRWRWFNLCTICVM